MSLEDDAITRRVEVAMQAIRSEHDIRSHTTHVAKVGRSHLVEVNIVVGPRFELQTVTGQDGLRQRIWSAVDRPIDAAWLTIIFTADPRWA
jgi:predicted Co/Zn/Cd cation transporter (cation efflux family)